ncbi:MAG: addiction module toxin, HicA family [Chloroflexi bacterium]|nr:addiction module toxin, HicA family [Chloroflexota bacterium]
MPKVRDAIRLVERDGWYYVRTRGSHRIFHHSVKSGIVVIAGRPGEDVPGGTWHGIMRQAGISRREQR